jgi:hypothetical protein
MPFNKVFHDMKFGMLKIAKLQSDPKVQLINRVRWHAVDS